MKISEVLKEDRVKFSIEVFPPKVNSDYQKVEAAVERLCALQPDFMSVTYGAGGSTAQNTVKIASHVQNDLGVNALCHLTCVCADEASVTAQLDEMQRSGLENILALRGDRPAEPVGDPFAHFQHASELMTFIKKQTGSRFCIGGACYPECHPESATRKEDIDCLLYKQEAGAQFLTTQLFYDNNVFYNFLYRARTAGITLPILAGIMPVVNGKQIKRITKLSDATLPVRFKAIIDRFGDDPAAMEQAGIAYAAEQIIDLIANGVDAIHLYTMNRPDIAERIYACLSNILKREK